MKFSRFAVSLALLSCLAPAARASIIEQGSVELSASGAWQHQSLSNDFGTTTFQIGGSIYSAFSDLIQGGLGILGRYDSLESRGDSVNASSFGFDGGLRFNFGDSESVVPYLQAGVGFIVYGGDLNDGASTTIQPGATLGVRLMVNDAASMNFGLSYLREINALGSENLDSDTFLLSLGLSVFPHGLSRR